MTHAQQIGKLGEDLAAAFLQRRGFVLVERNLKTRGGEIDLVMREAMTTVFVEVKTRSSTNQANPADEIHPAKFQKLERAIATYVQQHDIEDWRLEVVTVTIDPATKKAKIKRIPLTE